MTSVQRVLWAAFIAMLALIPSGAVGSTTPSEESGLLNVSIEQELNNLVDLDGGRPADDTQFDPLHLIRRSWKHSPVISIDDLMELRKGGEHPVKEMVGESSPANMAILFVSNSEGCAAMASVFSSLANSYWADLERRRSVSTSRLFFLTANLTRGPSRSFFRDHRVTKVPTLVVIPSGSPYPARDFPEEWVMDPLEGGSKEMMGRWIESHSGSGFRLSPSVLSESTATAAIAGTFTTALENWGIYLIAAQVLIILLANAYRFTSKVAWMTLSIGVYFFSVSGCIFCFLRGVGPFGYSEQYGFIFIYPDRNGQFFFEGLAIGFLNCMISLVLVVAAEMNTGRDAVAEMEEWFDGEPPLRIQEQRRYENTPTMVRHRWEGLLRTAGICIGVALVLLFNLVILFRRKAPWYRPFSF